MRKFKHKKHGYIAKQIPTAYMIDVGITQIYSPIEIEGDPENWEEVIEKDYEILQYLNTRSNKVFNAPKERPPLVEIHSVKRLSDGEVFSVGNLHQSPFVNTCKIDKIYEKDGVIWLDHVSGATRLDQAVKVETRTPILTSEDGVELFEGDTVYLLHEHYLSKAIAPYELGETDERVNNMRYFSTRSAAEEYRTWHSYRLCYQDVMDVAGKILPYECAMRFKNLVRSRL